MRFLSKIEHWKLITFFLIFYDCVAVAASYFFALWLRFDLSFKAIPHYYMKPFLQFLPFYLIITIGVFIWLHLYRSIWRFASYDELFRMIVATIITFILHIIGITFIIHQRMPISYYVFGIVLQFVFTIGIRFSYRFILLLRSRYFSRSEKGIKKVMLIGAGAAGTSLLRDMKKMSGKDVPCCFIDDNSNKWGRFIDGIKIEGGRESIGKACEKYDIDKIYFVIPSISNSERKKILNICKETGCELRILPDIVKLTNGEVSVTDMKDVAVEDLLGRDQILVNMDDIFHQLEGKRILVTGGGGSIGSELCRQIAAHNPKQLIIFDVYENNAYEIQQELKKKYPKLDLQTIIGSVRDSRKVWKLFEDFHPEIVYHAAAHKHVPLMEDSPCESIKNNTIGTYKTAYAAMVFGTERFVLISTDKAVNPTNIMGASKRLCEMVVQAFDAKVKAGEAEQLPQLFTHWLRDRISGMAAPEILKNAKTEFVAVRFGNVLGSNGSVIPLFKKQIAAGGPVTVTHPDIIRYFMTIPEAVSLVLQAGTLAKGGEIFVLDMGEPVKIDTLARNLIKLSGLKPDVDIMIEYTGLRPGEKLYEEKLMAEEGLQKTDNELIHIGSPIPFDTDIFLEQLTELMTRAYNNDSKIRDLVQEIVPTYKPAHNCSD